MKNSPLVTFLLGVLAVSAVLSVIFCALYVGNVREYRSRAGQADAISMRREVLGYLAKDAVEYSRINPAIDPILEAYNLKPKISLAPTNKPGGK